MNNNVMGKYALFVAATPNYLSHINALLNSIYKRNLYKKCDLTVYFFHHDGFDIEYINNIQTAFPFQVIPVEITRGDFDLPTNTKRIEFIKRIRYKKMVEFGALYDVVCLLDADMFIVSDQFMALFDLIKGTDYLIGCNEKIKWDIGDNYFFEDTKKPIFETPQKLMQFICNVPSIFDMQKWRSVVECYCNIAKNGRQYKHGDKDFILGIGDLHTWSIAIQKMRMNDKVIMFPMETMAQVHYTNMRDWTFPIVENNYWRSQAGDRIYIIHGRIARKNFIEGCIDKFRQLHKGREEIEKVENKIRNGLKAIQKEFYDLNYNSIIKLSDYIEIDPEWETFK